MRSRSFAFLVDFWDSESRLEALSESHSVCMGVRLFGGVEIEHFGAILKKVITFCWPSANSQDWSAKTHGKETLTHVYESSFL